MREHEIVVWYDGKKQGHFTSRQVHGAPAKIIPKIDEFVLFCRLSGNVSMFARKIPPL